MSPRATSTDLASIAAWAAELEAAAKIARGIAGTPFLPASHRRYHRNERGEPMDGKDGRPYRLDLDATTATAAAAIMRGWELGLPPGAALSAISVINDTPALSALALRAVLQNHGHDIWVLPESNASRAIVRARRAGSDEVQESTWTIERARALLGNAVMNNERSNWKRQPAAMLIARATAEAARWVAADAILGIPLVAEELMDQLDGDGQLAIEPPPPSAADGQPRAIEPPPAPARAASTARRRTTTQRRSASTASAPPLPTGPRDVPPDPAPPPAKLRKPQLDAIHIGLRDIGVGEDRDKALTLVSGWAGRRVETTKDLTELEAHAVLDGIEAMRSLGARAIADDQDADAERTQDTGKDDPA